MSDLDFMIWRRWWPSVQHLALRMWFDVGLGETPTIPEGTSADLAFMWERNNQPRADAIIEMAEDISLVELRENASGNAIGRLLEYSDLLDEDAPWPKPIRMLLVTNRDNPNVRRSAEKRGIRYIVV